MLIDSDFYNTLTIAINIGIFVGLAWFIKKKFNNWYGVFFGFVLSAFGYGLARTGAGKLYVVNPNMTASAYRFVGDVDYPMGNGQNLVIKHQMDSSKTYVINNAAEAVVLEEIVYKSTENRLPKPTRNLREQALDPNYGAPPAHDYFVIQPYALEKFDLPKQTINYFFDQAIPSLLKVHSGDSRRYWMHRVE